MSWRLCAAISTVSMGIRVRTILTIQQHEAHNTGRETSSDVAVLRQEAGRGSHRHALDEWKTAVEASAGLGRHVIHGLPVSEWCVPMKRGAIRSNGHKHTGWSRSAWLARQIWQRPDDDRASRGLGLGLPSLNLARRRERIAARWVRLGSNEQHSRRRRTTHRLGNRERAAAAPRSRAGRRTKRPAKRATPRPRPADKEGSRSGKARAA